MNTVAVGRHGEDMAERYLARQGMTTLARNVCVRGGEIDLVMRDGDYIVFVEVKLRTQHRFGLPAEAVNARKRRNLCRAALAYLAEHDGMDAFCRFDVVEIEQNDIRHLRNAFDASEALC